MHAPKADILPHNSRDSVILTTIYQYKEAPPPMPPLCPLEEANLINVTDSLSNENIALVWVKHSNPALLSSSPGLQPMGGTTGNGLQVPYALYK